MHKIIYLLKHLLIEQVSSRNMNHFNCLIMSSGITSSTVDVEAMQEKLQKEQKRNEHLTEVMLKSCINFVLPNFGRQTCFNICLSALTPLRLMARHRSNQ